MKHIQQTYTFSATVSDPIKAIIKQHIPSYEFIKIGESVTVDKIDHSYVSVQHEDKIANLIKLIQDHSWEKVLIFTQTKRNTKTLWEILAKMSYKVGMLHGDMSQNKRLSTLKHFKENDLKILVTTDVAAR